MSGIRTIKNKRLNEKYCFKKLENGLSVYSYPLPGKRGVYALMGADIGSTTREFTLGGKTVSAPAGTAHFLEHKLFESEKGDAFELFAKTGASANAYTSFERTCYLFSASINAGRSLETLLSFVSEPHFTKETVQKEQGIIAQEIKMYDDAPEWALATMILRCLYSENPVRDDIAGTVESIAQISPEILYDCYRAFYRPENMALCVAGALSPEEVFETAERVYGGIENSGGEVERFLPKEETAVAQKSERRAMSVSMPQFCLGFKHSRSKPGDIKRTLGFRFLNLLLAGETSPLYLRLYDKGLLNETFDASTMDAQGFCCTTFSGESRDPDAVIYSINEEIERAKREGLSEERFEEHKRAMLGSTLAAFDSVEGVASRLMEAHFKQYGLYDIIDAVAEISLEEVNALLCESFKEELSARAYIDLI
ncbi:MAG: pitrilysin family protein [Oscillospiraceae bacterium]|nr:pitrilysin family protein [Oscillospiraceae bacterium]